MSIDNRNRDFYIPRPLAPTARPIETSIEDTSAVLQEPILDTSYVKSQLPSHRTWHQNTIIARIADFFRRIAHFFYSLLPNSSPDVSAKLLASVFGQKGIGSAKFLRTAGTSEVIKFMVNFLKKEAAVSGHPLDDNLIQKLEDCASIARELEQLAKYGKRNIKDIHDKIKVQIEQLKVQDYLLLPIPEGRSQKEVIYKITKLEDQTLQIEVISHDIHSFDEKNRNKKHEKFKTKIETNVVFSGININKFINDKIKKDDLGESFLQDGLAALISLGIPNYPASNDIISVMHKCGGRRIENSKPYYHTANLVGSAVKNVLSLIHNSGTVKSKTTKIRMKLRILFAFVNQSHEELKSNNTTRELVKEGIRSIIASVEGFLSEEEYNKIYTELKIIDNKILEIENHIDSSTTKGAVDTNVDDFSIPRNDTEEFNLHVPDLGVSKASSTIQTTIPIKTTSKPTAIKQVSLLPVKEILVVTKEIENNYEYEIAVFSSEKGLIKGINAIKDLKSNVISYMQSHKYRSAKTEILRLLACFNDRKFNVAFFQTLSIDDPVSIKSVQELYNEMIEINTLLEECVKKEYALSSSKIPLDTLELFYKSFIFTTCLFNVIRSMDKRKYNGPSLWTSERKISQMPYDMAFRLNFLPKVWEFENDYNNQPVDPLLKKLSPSLTFLTRSLYGTDYSNWANSLRIRVRQAHSHHFNNKSLYEYGNNRNLEAKRIATQGTFDLDNEGAINHYLKINDTNKVSKIHELKEETREVVATLIKARHDYQKILQEKQDAKGDFGLLCRVFDILQNKPYLIKDVDVRHFILTVLTLQEDFDLNHSIVQDFDLNPFANIFDKESYKNILPSFVNILKTLTLKYNTPSQVSAFTFILNITNMMYAGVNEEGKELLKELIDEQNQTLNRWKTIALQQNHPLYKHRSLLHKQYILSFENKKILEPHEIKELFFAKAVIANSQGLSIDVNPPYDFKVIEILKTHEKSFQKILKNEKDEYLKNIAQFVGLKKTEKWQGEYPYYFNEDGYKIDLYTAEVFFPSGEKLGFLPETLLNHKDVKQAFNSKLLLNAKVELIQKGLTNTYILKGEGVEDVAIEVTGSKVSIFRLIEGKNKEKQYVQFVSKEALFDPKIHFTPNPSFFTYIKELINYLYNCMRSKDLLPGIFNEDNRSFWLNPNKPEEAYVINSQGALNFITELSSKGFGKIVDLRKGAPKEYELGLFSANSHPIFNMLSNFCNRNDITVFKRGGKICYIELMQVGLEFAIEDGKIICKSKDLNGWILDPMCNTTMDKQGVEKSMVLISADGKQKRLIVPNRQLEIAPPRKKIPSGFKLLIKFLKMIIYGLPQIQKHKNPSSKKYELGKFNKPDYYVLEMTEYGKIIPKKETEIQSLSQLALLSLADSHYGNSYKFLQQIDKKLQNLTNNKIVLEKITEISNAPIDTPNAIAVRLYAAFIIWKHSAPINNRIENNLLSDLYESYLAKKNHISPNLLLKNTNDHDEILAYGVTNDFHKRHPQFAEQMSGKKVTQAIIEPATYKHYKKLDTDLWTTQLTEIGSSQFQKRYEVLKQGVYEKGDLDSEFEEIFETLSSLQSSIPELPMNKENEIHYFLNHIESIINTEDPEITRKVFSTLKEENFIASQLAAQLKHYVRSNKNDSPPITINELENALEEKQHLVNPTTLIKAKENSEIYHTNKLATYFKETKATSDVELPTVGILKNNLLENAEKDIKENENTPKNLLEDVKLINKGIGAALTIEKEHNKKYTFLGDNERTILKNQLTKDVKEFESGISSLATQQKTILDILQPKTSALQKLQNLGERVTKVDWNDLIICYLKQDFSTIEAMIPDGTLEDLKMKLTNYFIDANKLQKMKVALQIINKLEKNINVEKLSNDLHQLLSSQSQYEPALNPHILVMEYLSNFAIRADQITMVNDLITNPNCIRQAMTGAGKTSVILVLSALLKANGKNMVSVIFPKSLFTENLKHLEAKLGKIFDINIYPLEYSMQTSTRTKNGEPSYFEKMYHDLLKVIHSKGCVVTTVETMHALEQKWKRLLDKYSYNIDNVSNEDRIAINYLSKVIKLCRTRQDAIIDEIDKATNPKSSNNCRFGKAYNVNPMYQNVLLDIYDIILQDERIDIINNNQGDLFDSVGTKVIEHAVDAYIEKFYNDTLYDKTHLRNYFLGNTDKTGELDSFIQSIETDANRDLIVLAKDAFVTFIPLALSKSGNKRYARSANGKDVVLCSYSDTPRENSEPQELMEKMAYTIQDYYARGVTDQGMKSWYKQKIEEAEKGEKELKEVENLFRNWFKEEFTFDENAYKKLIPIINKSIELKKVFLKIQLDSIKISDRTIQNDAFHIASMCKNVAGVTATPPNALTLHDKFDTKDAEKPEVKGKMILNALRKARGKEQNILFEGTKPKEIIGHFNDYHTVVDSSGATKGVSIDEVVEEVFAKKDEKIKGVCFFDSGGHLLVRVTDGVIKKEDCKLKPEELGMVLKEDKARGADVVLGDDNKFIVIVDDKQTLSSILQAVGRSRKEEQHIQFATPNNQNLNDFYDVIYSGTKLEAETNAENIYRAQKQKLMNILHDAMLDELLAYDLMDESNITPLLEKFNSFKNIEDEHSLGLKNLFVIENESIEEEGAYYNKHKNLQQLKDPIDELNALRKKLKKFATQKLNTQKEDVLDKLKEQKASFKEIKDQLPRNVLVSGFNTNIEVDVDNDLDLDIDLDTEIDLDTDLDVEQAVQSNKDFRFVGWDRNGWGLGINLDTAKGKDACMHAIMHPNLIISSNLAIVDEAKLQKYYKSITNVLKNQEINVNDLTIPIEASFNIKYILYREIGINLYGTLLDIQDYKEAVSKLTGKSKFAIFDLGLNTFIENENFDVNQNDIKMMLVQSKIYRGQYNDYSDEEVAFLKEWIKNSEQTLKEMNITFEQAFIKRLSAKGVEEVAKYENSQLKIVFEENLNGL